MKNKSSYILGLNISHNATACLMKDGEIVGCVSEERFSRKKNQQGFPKLAVKYLLNLEKISVEDLSLVVNGGTSFTPSWDPVNYKGISKFVHNSFYTIASYSSQIDKLLRYIYKFVTKNTSRIGATNILLNSLSISKNKLILADHHKCHAYAAYFGFVPKNLRGNSMAIATLDGEGDMLCSSVWKGKNNKLELVSTTSAGNSPAAIYAVVTRILGMKINEHEYKVMGLAPYAKAEYSNGVWKILKELIHFDKKNLVFKAKYGQRASYIYLKRKLNSYRFDSIAFAVQKWTEDLMTEFADSCLKKLKANILVVGGGWYMNVKGNMEIVKLKSLKNLFVCPSGGDESLAIGACYVGYEVLNKNSNAKEIANLYLGIEYTDKQINQELKAFKNKHNFKIKKYQDINKEVIQLLIKGKAVARFSGRMEWGARALGNRTILADPRNVEIKKTINEQIKNRDFWMPFAPSILPNGAKRYLVNPKSIQSEHMVLAFDTTKSGRIDLAAATHPYDNTVRPQVVTKAANPQYYNLIKLFEDKTGVSGVLNTSFNLHGDPIVCSPSDAISTFLNSGLEYLALGSYLLSKY